MASGFGLIQSIGPFSRGSSKQTSPDELDPTPGRGLPGTEVVPTLCTSTQDKVPGLEVECGPRVLGWAGHTLREEASGQTQVRGCCQCGGNDEAVAVKLHPEP